eukprot:11922986-Alexandrium_andersonii.AAC.1
MAQAPPAAACGLLGLGRLDSGTRTTSSPSHSSGSPLGGRMHKECSGGANSLRSRCHALA